MKPIKGFEGIYSITEDGKVWSHQHECFIKPKVYGKMTSPGYRLYGGSSGSVTTVRTLMRTYFPKENPEFKYIHGYEGQYGVSTDGRVWSYVKGIIISGRRSTTSPYLYVDLYKNNRSIKYSIHRLVATTYIQNPDNLPEVDHIDRDIYNNDVSNLRWTTRKGNLLNTDVQFTRNFRECDLYNKQSFVRHFKSVDSASKYASEQFGASFSGMKRNLHSRGCEIKVERLA